MPRAHALLFRQAVISVHSIMTVGLDDYMYHDQSLQCCLSGLHWATSGAGHDGREAGEAGGGY